MTNKLDLKNAPTAAQQPSADGESNWLPNAERTLKTISEWPENWDSYGAAAPRAEAVQAANTLLRELACRLALPEPYISATRDGGVFVQWTANGHEIDMSIESADDVTFAYENLESGKRISGNVAGEASTANPLFDVLDMYFCN